MRYFSLAAILSLAVVITGCGGGNGKVASPTGVVYRDITAGTSGTDVLSMRQVYGYQIIKGGGKTYDTSTSKPDGEFIDLTKLPIGVIEGLRDMKLGGDRVITVPAGSAYKSVDTSVNIPANTDISYDLQLGGLPVTASGLQYKDLTVGTGAALTQNDYAFCKLTVSTSNGDPAYETAADNLDVLKIDSKLPTAIQEGLLGIKAGGKRMMVVTPDLGYGQVLSSYSVASNATARMDVDVQNIQTQTTASGLIYYKNVEGTGATPTSTDTVKVEYIGKLTDGTVFDSSDKHGGPQEFAVTGVIDGWTEILEMMPVGSTWTVIIPPELGYGDQAQSGIPANSTLVFNMKLEEIVPPDTTE